MDLEECRVKEAKLFLFRKGIDQNTLNMEEVVFCHIYLAEHSREAVVLTR